MNDAVDVPASLRRTRLVAVAAAAGLVALGIAWELWLAPTGRGSLAIKVLPIALALPGLWRDRLYTYRWTSLLLWLYVAEGAVRATSDRGLGAPLAVGEIALSLLLFAACGVHIRTWLRMRGAAAVPARAGAASP